MVDLPEEDLWKEVLAAMEFHRKHPAGIDPSAQAALDRVVAKCLGFKKEHRIDSNSCLVRQEQLELNELSELHRHHSRQAPQRDLEPIIVLEFQGRRWLIDGHNRVSLWISQANAQSRRALIVTPREAAA